MSASPIKVLHVNSLNYLPASQTFVHARVLNPVCQRPVPFITGWVCPEYRQCQEITFYEENVFYGLKDEDTVLFAQGACSSPYYHRVIYQTRPQLLHAHFARAGERCLATAHYFNIPLVINFYGIETKWWIHDANWLPRIQRLYAQADAFICSSDAMKKDMINSGCPDDKITVIRCGIDTDFFCGETLSWQAGQHLRLLSIARLDREKGLTYLLHTCRLLNQSGFKDWQLKIIGVGPEGNALKQQVQDDKLHKQVFFLGNQSQQEVREALREAHIKILPSLKETQGVVLQEAQATCTPFIATNIGGIPEGVLDGESGFLVKSQSSTAILEKIETLLSQPELLVKMGCAGRRYITQHFSRKNEYQQLTALYRSLLK